MAALIVLVVLALFALFIAAKTIRIIPQARAGVVERFDYSAELEKSAYHRWFTGLFEGFVAALDHGAAAAAAPFLEDIRRVASVVEHAYTAARSGTTVAIPGSA